MELVCFDLDGCLVDSSGAIPRAVNQALVELGIGERPEGSLTSFIGPPLLRSFELLLEEEGLDPTLARRAVGHYRAVYPELARRHTRLVPGVDRAVDALSGRCELRIVTSKPREFAVPILQAVGILERFAAVHAPSLDALEETKEVTLACALADAGVPPPRTVMVGDHPADMLAGRTNGTMTVGVTWGSATRQELEDSGADEVVGSPDQLTWLLLHGQSSSSG